MLNRVKSLINELNYVLHTKTICFKTNLISIIALEVYEILQKEVNQSFANLCFRVLKGIFCICSLLRHNNRMNIQERMIYVECIIWPVTGYGMGWRFKQKPYRYMYNYCIYKYKVKQLHCAKTNRNVMHKGCPPFAITIYVQYSST